MPGPFRSRAEELAYLRRTTPRYRVPFPDLKVPSTCAPTSNVIAVAGSNTPLRLQPAISLPDFVVATTHKQGPAVHHRREIEFLGGRKI